MEKIKKICDICLYKGSFVKKSKNSISDSIREGFCCPKCGSSLRYQEQFAMIKSNFDLCSKNDINDFVKLVVKEKLSVYEPGIIGPFRNYFNNISTYSNSYYWEDIAAGDYKDGIQCQNLENLTYDDSTFDLIITSDIFEHIRDYKKAFKEIRRVLKNGGMHIFTVPIRLGGLTLKRVDTSGNDDVFLQPKHYHGSPIDLNGSLVYNDFGLDIVYFLDNELGFVTKYNGISNNITFCSIKNER